MKITLRELIKNEFGNGLVNPESNIVIQEVTKPFLPIWEDDYKINTYVLPMTPFVMFYEPRFKHHMIENKGADILEEWDEDIWNREVTNITSGITSNQEDDFIVTVITLKEIIIDNY